ncbi:MAG: ABC transporter permease, partial [Peptostreptococcaceae bacterium]
VFLALVLPYLFSIIFSFEGSTEDINVGIVGNKNSKIIESYTNVLNEFDKDNDKINLKYEIYSEDEVNLSEDEKKDDLNIFIDEKNKNVKFCGANFLNMGERSIEGITEEFFNSISIYEFVSNGDNVLNINNEIVKVSKHKSESVKKTLDIDYEKYFAIVMLQMAILAGGIYSLKNTFYLKENIGKKIKASPIKMFKVLSLELMGSFLLIFTQGLLLLLLIKIVYGVDVNFNNILPVISLIGSISILSVSIGIFGTAVCKKISDGESFVSILVTGMTLASGALTQQGGNAVKSIPIAKINPFVGVSNELNSLLTYNTTENFISAVGVALIASFVLLALSTLILNRKVVK